MKFRRQAISRHRYHHISDSYQDLSFRAREIYKSRRQKSVFEAQKYTNRRVVNQGG